SRDPNLKVDISVGGWAAGGFSEAAGTAAGRKAFADSAAQMLVAHDADGLDIDREYPGHNESGIASSPNDRRNFTLLLKTVRASLDATGAEHHRHYTLSIAVADGPFVSGVDPGHDGLYQPYKKFVGKIPWPKLRAEFIGRQGFVRHWDARADASWLWNAMTHTFITCDDPESIAARAAFVKAQHPGGIMYWEQSLDPTDELLDAIWRGLR
ncbi:MAG: chitinase, partial [Xanthomonadaceae bacterium]|nr:chitinase [Xanthomonadaceae bacterium]